MDRVDAVVIGAGVVGLAIARELAIAGREVVILDAEDAIGTHTSSRNSEVIHAGIYYPQGSLKARACVAGRHLQAESLPQAAGLRAGQASPIRVLRAPPPAAAPLGQADRGHGSGAARR